MKREPTERLGCDRCKQEGLTYRYEALAREAPLLWFCSDCVAALLEWPRGTGGATMSDTKWVVSKYAKEIGEKWEVIHEHGSTWECKAPAMPHLLSLCLPKSEYIPCSPPERWEVVSLDNRLHLNKNARSFCIPDLFENERFAIKDGALVLERRVVE